MSLTSSRPWSRWLCCFGEANIHVSPYFSTLGCMWNRAGCTGHCFWATTQFHTILACPSIQSFTACTRWLNQAVLRNLKCIRTSNLQILKTKGKLPPPPRNSLQTGMTLWGQGRDSYCRLCSGSQWCTPWPLTVSEKFSYAAIGMQCPSHLFWLFALFWLIQDEEYCARSDST